jgi:AraC family transcriptional regulator of adaptative response/methylated-DNA-[protein]-cysteine methyltransferase
MHHEHTYKQVARALNWVADHQADQPDLERLSVEIGLSPYHLQRTFQDWAGVSPKQFLKSLTKQDALNRLQRGSTVLEAALETGLSGVLAWTERGINFLGFCEDVGYDTVINTLKKRWKSANFNIDQKAAADQLEMIFSDCGKTPIRLWLKGSPFQLKVWEALLSIPENAHASYGQIARVIRRLGGLGGYRWGKITKQAMIGYEASCCMPASR